MVPQVREATDRTLFQSVWIHSTPGTRDGGDSAGGADGGSVKCPSCRKSMGRSRPVIDGSTVSLDTCRACQLVWFDAGEATQVLTEPDAEDLSPEEREKQQTMIVEMIKLRGETRKNQLPQDSRSVFAALGLPVEHKTQFLLVRPIVTWIAAALIAFLFLCPVLTIEAWGFVPSETGRKIGLTLFVPFLLHASWMHVLSNLYFLLVFGDDVEVALGRLKYAGLLLGGTLIGNAFHGICTGSPAVAAVGASSGISAVLVFYAMAFPNHRIGLLSFWSARYWHVSARGTLLFWVGAQLVGGWFWQPVELATVSPMAHVGGAAGGLLIWWRWHTSGHPATDPSGGHAGGGRPPSPAIGDT